MHMQGYRQALVFQRPGALQSFFTGLRGNHFTFQASEQASQPFFQKVSDVDVIIEKVYDINE
jgi:hypothetical protein